MTVGFVGGGGYDRGRGGGGGYDRGGRGGYSSGGGGGGGGFSGDSEMTTQQDTIFIQGLPTDIDERSLASFFGQIGIIKVRLLSPLLKYSPYICILPITGYTLSGVSMKASNVIQHGILSEFLERPKDRPT